MRNLAFTASVSVICQFLSYSEKTLFLNCFTYSMLTTVWDYASQFYQFMYKECISVRPNCQEQQEISEYSPRGVMDS